MGERWRAENKEFLQLLSKYKHRKCGTMMSPPRDLLERAVLDPLYMPNTAECAECGDVLISRCITRSGESVKQVARRIRSEAPLEFWVTCCALLPLLIAVPVVLMTMIICMIVAPRLPLSLPFFLSAAASLLLFITLRGPIICKLRRRGWLWGGEGNSREGLMVFGSTGVLLALAVGAGLILSGTGNVSTNRDDVEVSEGIAGKRTVPSGSPTKIERPRILAICKAPCSACDGAGVQAGSPCQ